jgi:septal ring factor EnvC (AmiA/AmiB activator)
MTNFASAGRRLCAALLLGLLCMSASAQSMTEAERQARLKELRETIEQLQIELNKVKSDRQGLMSELQTSETQIGELSRKVQELRKQLDDKQSHLQKLNSEKEALLTAKKQQQGSVARHLDAAYRLGQQSSLKMLLNQQDPSLLARNLHYYRYFTQAQADEVKRYTGTIARIEELEPTIAAEAQAISRSHSELRGKRDQLQTSQQERKRTLAKLERTIADTDAKLKSADEDRHHLERLLREVVRITGDMQLPASTDAFGKLKGQLPWPTSGKLLHSFGSPRVANKVRWQGMLIGAPEGHPVLAVHQGRVVFADYLRGQGLLLIIDHGAGFMSLYAHNQSLFKNLGDWVGAGEQVASVGLSGGQSNSALYFELRYKGEPTDPRPWLRKAA